MAPTDGGYNCVPFSYGNSADPGDQKDSEMDLNASSFHPSFPIPENLLRNLPPTEKVHQIIARTAMFVGQHGGQSEIVLRVKQGDNPTFGFLMPQHHLHPYFRYLADHPEILKTDNDSKSTGEKTNSIQASGALSLLGSVYDSGEDEDVAAEVDKHSEQLVSGDASSASDMQNSDQSEQIKKDETDSIHPRLTKAKVSALNKYSINSIKPGRSSSTKSDRNITSSIGSSVEKPKASGLFPLPEVKTSLVDPPSEIKRLVDRTVEIILKNGKDFETVLVEQDKDRGKFPFLLPHNQYNPYYLRAMKKAQETRISGKTFLPGKDSSSWQEIDKNSVHQLKENDVPSLDGSDDLDVDPDKKEKFKMVIPKPKKDAQDPPSKESQTQRGFTIDATAAILQAATRGIKNPNLSLFSKTSHASTTEGEQSLAPFKEADKSSGKDEIAKLAARVTGLAASEANSSEAGLARQQKLRAERLRRAKMFAAMLKSGAAPLGSEPVRASSVEPSGSVTSGSAAENVVEDAKGITSVQNLSNDETEHKLSRSRQYRSNKHDDHGQEEEGKDEKGENSEDVEDKKRSLKRHKSRHSSRHRRDRSEGRHKHRRRHSSSKRKESRHRHKHDSSSMEDENPDNSSEEERKHRRKHPSSKTKESRNRHKHDSSSLEHDDDDRYHWEKSENSSEEERKHRKRRHKHDSSSDEDNKHHKRRHKRSHRKDGHRDKSGKDDRSHTGEVELEEGEILTRSSDQSLSAVIGDDASVSIDASKSPHPEIRSSVPPTEVTEVPDELRAKIRAMLLATR